MLKVYKKKKEKEEDIYLKLIQSVNEVALVVVNRHGEKHPAGTILYISKERGLHLCSDLDDQIGLPLDNANRIKQKQRR